MLSMVWTSLGKEPGLAEALKQTLDEATTRSGGDQRRKPIPAKPPRRKNQQQQQKMAPFQTRPILTSSPSPAFQLKATTSKNTPMGQDRMGVAEKKRQDREHCDEECAEEVITKAFQFLSRPKRGRDMTASEILEYYLERRQRAQLEQQGAVWVGRALDINATSNSSITSTLSYVSNLDTAVLARNDESNSGLSGQLLAAEEHQQPLTTKMTASEWQQKLLKGSHSGPHNHYQKEILLDGSKEELLINSQQHIYETQAQMIVTSTTAGCKREPRWQQVWRKLKRIFKPHRNNRPKNQPIVDEQPLTDRQATVSSTCSIHNLHQAPGLNTGLGSRFDSHRQSMKKRAKSRCGPGPIRHSRAV